MSDKIEVTIAVCTYNRADLLPQALKSLFSLKARCLFEVVIVDNDSTDETSRVIEEMTINAPIAVRGFVEKNPGIAFARNRAVSEARGEWIAFFDDDQIAHPDWLEQLLAMARGKNVKCVGGRILLMLPESCRKPLPALCRSMLGEKSKIIAQRYTRRHLASTGNLLIHHSIFEIVGVFDESFAEGGEDTNFYLRLHAAGMDAWYTPNALVWHMVYDYRLGKPYLLNASRRYGWIVAHQEKQIIGITALPFLCFARFLRSFLALIPWREKGPAPATRGRVLEFKCLTLRALGYAQYTLCALTPSVFRKVEFLKKINFRADRQIFDTGRDPDEKNRIVCC